MDRQTFTWNHSGNKLRRTERWVEGLWVVGLLLAALLLFGINLGNPPLLDWGEGPVALMARELARSPEKTWQWLYPIPAGSPQSEASPLVTSLIASFYWFIGVNTWTTRLPGAILSTLSVPLLYGIGREVFPTRQSAIFSSFIYLTSFPVVSQGRLAFGDGMTLCLVMLMMWCVLRSRRDFRWALGAGIGLGFICLAKGIAIGLVLLAIAIVFLGWDTPRLLSCAYWWLGLLLGSAPGLIGYAALLLQDAQMLLGTGTLPQSLQHFWSSVTVPNHPLWYYPVELVKFSVPWVFFWSYGLYLAWENRNWGWAKLVLVWATAWVLLLGLMTTRLSWDAMPVYPALALAGGAQLAEVWNWPGHKAYPRLWSSGLAILGLVAIALSLYFAGFGVNAPSLSVVLAAIALTLVVAAALVARRDLQFVSILFWGTYISLLLLVTSNYWLGKVNAGYPVEPIAALLRRGTPAGQVIYTSLPQERPALKFYSDHQVIPASNAQLQQHWEQDPEPYLLLDTATLNQLNLKPARAVGTAPGWKLITKESS